MKLVFYSGGDEKENKSLDKALRSLIKSHDPVVTFIPSSSYLSEQEFSDFVRQYSKYKISKFIHFPVDIPFDRVLFAEVMKSDAIHLGGGNTFYFLNTLRKMRLLPELRKFVREGGVLSGLSAGAIIMTNDIEMAGYPEFDRDENFVNIKNLSSLKLVDFDFFPHFKNSRRYDEVFKKFSLESNKVIYACPDGSGIVVNGKETKFIGRCFAFTGGHKFKIN